MPVFVDYFLIDVIHTSFKCVKIASYLFLFQEIDEYIAQARTKGYSAILSLGHRGLKYCTNIVVKTAIKVFIIIKKVKVLIVW